jgi:hypothetical protein
VTLGAQRLVFRLQPIHRMLLLLLLLLPLLLLLLCGPRRWQVRCVHTPPLLRATSMTAAIRSLPSSPQQFARAIPSL